MIRTNPSTTFPRIGIVPSLILLAAMAAGFVAGQVTPDVVGGLISTSPTRVSAPQAQPVTAADDFGIRHAPQAPRLSAVDDYGTRHMGVGLTPIDDYGVRHGD